MGPKCGIPTCHIPLRSGQCRAARLKACHEIQRLGAGSGPGQPTSPVGGYSGLRVGSLRGRGTFLDPGSQPSRPAPVDGTSGLDGGTLRGAEKDPRAASAPQKSWSLASGGRGNPVKGGRTDLRTTTASGGYGKCLRRVLPSGSGQAQTGAPGVTLGSDCEKLDRFVGLVLHSV